MLGYVRAQKSELKVREYEMYNAYYCGLCKSLGENHGQAARMALSYDFAFLALLIDALRDDEPVVEKESCIAHHIKKRLVVRKNPAVDFAADMMVLLVYYNLLDDIEDENSLKAKAAIRAFKGSFEKLSGKYGQTCAKMENALSQLHRLEREKCAVLDLVCEPFSEIMEAVFSQCPLSSAEENRRQLAYLGRFLGKWIYLADAWDDIEKDLQSGSYNPLFYRFSKELEESLQEADRISNEQTDASWQQDIRRASVFRERIREKVSFSMTSALAEVSKAFELLEIRKNREIPENIIYIGLLSMTDSLLEKGKEKDPLSEPENNPEAGPENDPEAEPETDPEAEPENNPAAES
ncbi:MAG: DUF5685 family protein [Clostridia bacterium]|nr:DUF5685 family protein [Clostridia bacterium]